MTKLTWGDFGQRFYESGADRGVLYIPGLTPVAWNGLTAVNEAPTGGDAKPYYYDGFKYLNLSSSEEYEATIEAFSSPPEFARCDGTGTIHAGLFITQQPRKSFSFCYRTLIGNDIDALEHGYKLHLVYNALAGPSARSNKTLSNSVEPLVSSWGITTLPPAMTGFKPSAHVVIDSRQTSDAMLRQIEDLLYGTDTTLPSLPTPEELAVMFAVDYPFNVADLGNGHYTAEGYGVVEQVIGVSFTLEDDSVTDHHDGSFDIQY